jgi:uncharacterized protein with HEPN domain
MPPRPEDRLRDMLQASDSIRTFLVDADFETLAASDALTSQIYWKMAVIGEAAARSLLADPHLGDNIPELVNLSDVRNRVIHGYESISNLIIWTIIHDLLPPVLHQISDYLGHIE